jgi:hypothetical protein
MPQAHCPSCGKQFKDHSSVARHMSQPRSGCNSWLEDLIQLRESTILSRSSPEDHPMEVDNIEPHIDFVAEGESIGGVSGSWGGSQDEGSEACASEATDYFPNPPLAFEEGYTFLSLFDQDENSIYRKTNLYYPFSCRKDWQVASWLLRSGLSMAKIDSFLSLEMVSVSKLQARRRGLNLGITRLKIYLYHSTQQKICGVELKLYRAVRVGSRN